MYNVGLFTVDEYISIAKEKHGYNTEQVGDCSLCACGGGECMGWKMGQMRVL